MTAALRCHACLFQAEAQDGGAVGRVLAAGGQRRPSEHPDLAGFRLWVRSLDGQVGPISGRCPACDQPLVREGQGGAASGEWRVTLPAGEFRVGADGAEGPDGPMAPAAALAVVHRALTPTVAERVFDVRLIFVLVALGLVLLVGLVWLGAVSFLFNWFMAVGSQNNFGAPGLR